MTLLETLDALRELGVYIPDAANSWDDAQLTALGKRLNPWTVSVSLSEDGYYIATTRSNQQPDGRWENAEAPTAGAACIFLLHKQLKEGRYTVNETRYKTSAAERRTL